MGKTQGYSYIEQIGIKKTLLATNMGNVIHILNNGKKYKEFGSEYSDLSDSINQEFKENLETQTEEYGHPLISFPELVIADNKTLYGVVSDFEIGYTFPNIDDQITISRLLGLIDYMEHQIEQLSKKGWKLEDIHEENILLNPGSSSKPIRIIDTDFYCLQPYKDKIELYRSNIEKIFVGIIASLIPNFNESDSWLEEDINEKYFLAANGLIKTSEFIKYLLKRINFTYNKGENVQTLRKSI